MAKPKSTAKGTVTEFTWRPGAQRELDVALGYGILNAMLYAEDRAKADTVVRGGHRSYLTGSHLGGPLGIRDVPGQRGRGKVTVGGNLRRSTHARVAVHGRVIGGATDENGNATPSAGGGTAIEASLGTNSGYGLWVDQGTSKMPARPSIIPALQAMLRIFPQLMKAGAARWLG